MQCFTKKSRGSNKILKSKSVLSSCSENGGPITRNYVKSSLTRKKTLHNAKSSD